MVKDETRKQKITVTPTTTITKAQNVILAEPAQMMNKTEA